MRRIPPQQQHRDLGDAHRRCQGGRACFTPVQVQIVNILQGRVRSAESKRAAAAFVAQPRQHVVRCRPLLESQMLNLTSDFYCILSALQ